MKSKLLVVSVFILIASAFMASVSMAFGAARAGDWITNYRIEDAATGRLIVDTAANVQGGSIIDGAQLKVTVTISVPTSAPSTMLSLSTAMSRMTSKDHYWEHDTTDGYSLGAYNPNAQTISFSQAAGVLTIACYGVATGKVTQQVGSVTLHKAVPISLVSLKDPSNTILDEVKLNITDSAIDEYNTLLAAKQQKLAELSSSGVATGYVDVYQNIVTQSQAVAGQGLTDAAIAMLESLNVTNEPAGAVMQNLFLPLVVVFAVIAGLFGFLFMRIRGKVSYYRLVIEDQIKDLEGLTLRASKIDRTISSSLASVEDRLKRLVGM
jgi:hypothetical protein